MAKTNVFIRSSAVTIAVFAALLLITVSQARAATTTVEAETMTLSGSSSLVVHSSSVASGGKDLAFYSNGSASSGFDGAATQVVLHARGTACEGNPQFKVYVDNVLQGTVDLTSPTFADYTVPLSGLTGGTHTLRVSFVNDFSSSTCDRNAYLDYYVLTTSDSPPPPPPPSSPVLVGAGDIASCSSSDDAATAALLDSIPGTVFTAGDNAYDSGTASEFANCYDPTWGRHKARTMPTVGNHEYQTAGASGYFSYFGTAAGDPTKGYYSYNLGEWHVVALNSMCENVGGCGATSPMVSWLKQDLSASTKACTIAIWHHPLFSSGEHGNDPKMKSSWDALYAANADVIVNGHDHDYERFAPQDPNGAADTTRGMREFVVGTGGASHTAFFAVQPNSQVRDSDTFGVLKLTLNSSSYDWQFVPESGKTFTDSGSTICHAKAPSGDSTPPTVSSVAPPDGTTGATATANAEATFSEAMEPSSITSSTFTLVQKDTGTPIAATVSYDANTNKATLHPNTALQPGTAYTATLKGGSGGLKDVAGNPLGADRVWSFTTAAADTTAPTIISVEPAEGASGVALSSNAGATFSEAMDKTSVETSGAFTLLKQGTVTPVNATVTYDSVNRKAILDPSANLEEGTIYTAAAKGGIGGVKDMVGNGLAADKVWSFTTVISAPSNLTATRSGTTKAQRIDLSWLDNSKVETKFVIERSTTSSFTTNLVRYEVGANVQSYSDTVLQSKTKYYYRVFVVDAGGTKSASSNVASATTR
jgi:hypothetical protein